MKAECGMLKAEGGVSGPLARAARTSHSASRGITLVELLIAMAIMAILAAAIMGAAAAAMESARRSRTQALVSRISQLIIERMASYETRRIDVNSTITSAIELWARADPVGRSIPRGQMLADARLLGVRELIKLEMPDRWEDIELYANPSTRPLVLSAVPALTRSYLRRVTPAQTASNGTAELLYLVVMNATGDGEARTLFSKQDIGDEDEDGLQEFIDGWGQPIRWIRWPAGLVSDLQPVVLDEGTSDPNDLMRVDHDPLDAFRRDDPEITGPPIGDYPAAAGFQAICQANIRDRLGDATRPLVRKQAFRMTPLVYSIGPGGEPANRIAENPVDLPPLDPYCLMNDEVQIGEVIAADREKATDDITNHLMEY